MLSEFFVMARSVKKLCFEWNQQRAIEPRWPEKTLPRRFGLNRITRPVKKGQQIGTVNLAEIKEKNYDPTTMVIFTNGVKEQTLVVLDQSKNDITSVISKDAIERDGK